jgi:hypothetical protein
MQNSDATSTAAAVVTLLIFTPSPLDCFELGRDRDEERGPLGRIRLAQLRPELVYEPSQSAGL